MHFTPAHSALFFLLSSLVTATPFPPGKRDSIGAVYFMTNDLQGNSIIVNDVMPDGTVKFIAHYPTGGLGGANVKGTPNPDALRTQGSLVVMGNKLYASNAGSNTITEFEINPRDPTKLKMIGRPVDTEGDFPLSIAVSSKTGNVCVLNGGKRNTVHCFKSTTEGLVKINNSSRPVGILQTSPPSKLDSLESMSTIIFNRDETKLVIDVKGRVTTKTPGFLAAWEVNPDGSLSANHQTYPAPTKTAQLNFGMTRLNSKDGFIVSEPTVGGIIYDFSKGWDAKNATIVNFALPGQTVVCWVNYASKSKSYFLSDFGQPNVFEVSVNEVTNEVKKINQFHLPNNTVNVDHIIGTAGEGQWLYQLAPFGSSLFVFDIQPEGKTKMIQAYNFTQPLTRANVSFDILNPQGIAFKEASTSNLLQTPSL